MHAKQNMVAVTLNKKTRHLPTLSRHPNRWHPWILLTTISEIISENPIPEMKWTESLSLENKFYSLMFVNQLAKQWSPSLASCLFDCPSCPPRMLTKHQQCSHCSGYTLPLEYAFWVHVTILEVANTIGIECTQPDSRSLIVSALTTEKDFPIFRRPRIHFIVTWWAGLDSVAWFFYGWNNRYC